MLKKIYLISLILLIGLKSVLSQVGGRYTYDFLNLTNSARVASLGGEVISIPDADLNLPFHNPSLLNPEMDQMMVLNYVNYFSDIQFGYFSYSRNYAQIGSFAAGIHYINYGSFIAADETGAITGNFSAAEYSLNLIYSRNIDSLFRVGVNLKPILSTLESYTSFGLALDLGINYTSLQGYFSAGLVVKNIGLQLKAYHQGNYEALPFEIQFGASQKLKHAPFRFIFTAQHLERYKISPQEDEKTNNAQSLIYDSEQDKSGIEEFGDNMMRHFLFGLEFNPMDAFTLRFGYNYQRRQELQIPTKVSTVGFSWGFGLKLQKFQLSYGRATYHLSGASNHFSLTINLKEFN